LVSGRVAVIGVGGFADDGAVFGLELGNGQLSVCVLARRQADLGERLVDGDDGADVGRR
jgi:hypothetical protein